MSCDSYVTARPCPAFSGLQKTWQECPDPAPIFRVRMRGHERVYECYFCARFGVYYSHREGAATPKPRGATPSRPGMAWHARAQQGRLGTLPRDRSGPPVGSAISSV